MIYRTRINLRQILLCHQRKRSGPSSNRDNLTNWIDRIAVTAPMKTYLFSLAGISMNEIEMLVLSISPASTKIRKIYTVIFNSGEDGPQTGIWSTTPFFRVQGKIDAIVNVRQKLLKLLCRPFSSFLTFTLLQTTLLTRIKASH